MANQQLPWIPRKELAKLVFLIGLTIVGGSILYDYLRRTAKAPLSPNLAQAEDIKPIFQATPLPFAPDAAILQQVEDDAYLKTAPFYYLVHQMMTSSQEQIYKAVNPRLNWDALKAVERRAEYRGQIMRVRGGLLRLRRLALEGKAAEARGLAGGQAWEGVIYNVRGYLFIFVATELPPVVRKNDEIEVTGSFLKVWEYTNAAGETSRAPVIIGKNFSIMPRPDVPGPRYLAWPFLVLLAAILLMAMASLWCDRHQRQALSQLVQRIRRQRVKNPAK